MASQGPERRAGRRPPLAELADDRPPRRPHLYDCRKAFAEELIALAREDERIVAVCNDSVGSSNLVGFREEFPDRLINVGIAEQDLVGVGAGLANGGLIPFVSAAAPFLTGRALEQIKADVAYSDTHVVLCGQSPGMAYGELGPTHHSIEDLSWLRAVADLPSSCPPTPRRRAPPCGGPRPIRARATCASRGSRCRRSRPRTRCSFPAAPSRLTDGDDVTVIAIGTLVSRALDAAELLREDGIGVRVLNMPFVDPLDTEAVLAAARETRGIVTAEEATVTGGLGAAVASLRGADTGRPRCGSSACRGVRADRQRRHSCSTTSG